MKIPYGESNFKKIISNNFLYIDKTSYIETLENQGSFNILLRPRRFGKSLFLSSLRYYYDIGCKDEFTAIFGKLSIGRNPTPARNSYQVLFMDFSGISVDSDETILAGFTTKVETALQKFLKRYQYSRKDIGSITAPGLPSEKMDRFFAVTTNSKIYLLIDEYDHFANAVLGESLEDFKRIVGKGGFVRAFYETIKNATQEGIVDRLFITGVTSITLDSMTSGFNIGNNLTLHKDFNRAIGFTRDELKDIVQPMVDKCDLDRRNLMDELAKWYNGYRFSLRSSELVFNSDMVLYFVLHFDTRECEWPEEMLDENIASDYGKIMKLFAIGDQESNYRVLEDLITSGCVVASRGRKIDMDKGFDRDDFISLLLYMGFVTISGAELNDIRYTVPNYVIQRLYYEYFHKEIERRAEISTDSRRLKEAVKQLALDNNITPFVEEIANVLTLFSNRDYMNMDEKHIKAVILTLLYQSTVYFIQSEPEINNRYPDILLLERNPYKVNHQFLLELKYCKKGDGEQGWQAKKAEGIKQVREYMQLEDIRELPKLRSYVLLTNGSDVEAIAV